jgi:hypothetical protein
LQRKHASEDERKSKKETLKNKNLESNSTQTEIVVTSPTAVVNE